MTITIKEQPGATPMVVAHHPMKAAHIAAVDEIYPVLFGTRRIIAIDKTPKTDHTAYLYELRYRGDMGVCSTTVYEKFRSPEYAHYRSITLTHIDASGAIADQLHENTAQLTVQGFFDQATNRFCGPLIVVSLADVIYRVQTGRIAYKLRNRPRSVCTYIEILIEDLAPFAMYVKEYPR